VFDDCIQAWRQWWRRRTAPIFGPAATAL